MLTANYQIICKSAKWINSQENIPSFLANSSGTTRLYNKLLPHLVRHLLLLILQVKPKTVLTPRAQELLPLLRQGGLFLTGHLGYWEWMGAYLNSLDVPLVATYLPPKNKTVHKLLQRFRSQWGNKTIDISHSPLTLRRLIQEKQLFTILADQNYRSRTRAPSTHIFFGQAVDLNPLPQWIQKQFPKIPTYAGRIIRISSGVFELDLVKLQPGYTSYVNWLEKEIQQNPTQWAGWTHRIFFSQNPKAYF